jgi:hypothetical protein
MQLNFTDKYAIVGFTGHIICHLRWTTANPEVVARNMHTTVKIPSERAAGIPAPFAEWIVNVKGTGSGW